MPQVDVILSDQQLAKLRGAYSSDAMTTILSSGLPGLDPDTLQYVDVIRSQFYERATSRMQPENRERVLIGVLVSRDAGLNLALHVYVGLMAGLSPHDVADVIFLSGVYTGVDCISDGLAALGRTLGILAQLADADLCSADKVATHLAGAFRPAAYDVEAAEAVLEQRAKACAPGTGAHAPLTSDAKASGK